MNKISGLTPTEFVQQLEPKNGSSKSWFAMSKLYDDSAFAEITLKSKDAQFYQECSKIASRKAKDAKELEK